MAALLAGCGGGGDSNATISGTVQGLSANTSVVLTDNGADNLTVSSNGNFTFSQTISSQGAYNVQVATQPANQTCAVSYGSGVVDYTGDSIGNVVVACSDNAAISAQVTGLDIGNSVQLSLTLQNDPATALLTTVTATAADNGVANVNFTSASGAVVTLPLGTSYVVSVATQPTNPSQVCTVASGGTLPSGGVVNSNPITVTFNCK